VHTVELLDWAYGGPAPKGLERFEQRMSNVETEARKPRMALAAK